MSAAAPSHSPDSGRALRRAVFFDRDGVINVSPGPGYVLQWEDFQWMDGAIESLRLCHSAGWLTVLVTSQQGVGKGLMSQAALDRIHEEMQARLRAEGCPIDDIRSCTHLDGTCTCRKPSPKMVLDASAALGIDCSASILVGDADRDIVMARNAGVGKAVFFAADHGLGGTAADAVVASHAELQRLIASVP